MANDAIASSEPPSPVLTTRHGLGSVSWGVADQMLISATNLITMILLARGLHPEAFGSFVLAYSILLFANSLQSGLITQPHNLLGAGRRGDLFI